jgi:hypothetical protein
MDAVIDEATLTWAARYVIRHAANAAEGSIE